MSNQKNVAMNIPLEYEEEVRKYLESLQLKQAAENQPEAV